MKLKIICGILALVMISTGVIILSRPAEETIIAPPDNVINTVMDKPTSGDPSTVDAKHSLYIAQGELQRAGGFKGTSIGSSSSMGVSQGVASERVVVGKNAFKQSTSYSSMVKFGEQLYVFDDNYLSRRADKVASLTSATWKNTAKKYTEDGWMDKIGYRCHELTGYILNDDTIISAKLEKEENGLYTFRYVLDTETAPYSVLHEMRNNAGTDSFAKFEKAEIIVTMDKDWIVQTLTTDCKYKVTLNSVMQNILCTESLTETFYDIGYRGDLPYKDFFEKFFDSKPVDGDDDKELTPVDALMGMFEPFMGENKLYANLNLNSGEADLLSALICANIDITNTDNITFDVKMGDDLFVAYNKNNLYLTYQDFKASTTVDGIMGFVNTITALTSPAVTAAETDGKGLDLESLLSGLELIIDEDANTTTVHLPLNLGNVTIDANLVAEGTEKGKLTFTYAHVSLGAVGIDIAPIEKWDVPEREGVYPELLGLTDLLDNGVISLNANVAGYNADVMFDIASTSLYAKCDQLNLNAALVDNTVFASLGEAKVKIALSDVGTLMKLLAPFISENVQMPEMDIGAIIAALANVSATNTVNGVKFAAVAMGVKLEILLAEGDNGWTLDSVEISAEGLNATIAPSERFVVPEIDADEYVDVTEVVSTFVPSVETLSNAENYRANLNLAIAANGKTYDACAELLYDKHGNVSAAATVNQNGVSILCAEVIYANNTVFVDVNGIKAAFAVNSDGNFDKEQLTEMLAALGQNELAKELVAKLTAIVENVKNVDLATIDFGNLISVLKFTEGSLHVTVNGAILGFGDVNLSVNAEQNGLTVGLYDLTIDNLTITACAQVLAVEDTVALPDTDDYVLHLYGEVAGVSALVSADFANMDICAEIKLSNDTIYARFVNDVLYVELGNARIKLNKQDAMALIGKLTGGGASALAAESFDLNAILNNLVIDLASDTPTLGFAMNGISVFVDFNRVDDKVVFENIVANFNDVAATVSATDKTPTVIDTDQEFQDAAPLIERALELVQEYTTANGIAANLQTSLTVNGKTYRLNVAVQYLDQLHASVTLCDQNATLVDLQLYYQNETLFVDVNGIRAAVKADTLMALIAQLSDNSANAEIADVIKNLDIEFLNEIWEIVSELPQKLKDLSVAEILTSLTSDGNVWTLTVNAETLGLGNFQLSLDLDNTAVTLTNLSIGRLTINSLVAEIATFDGVIEQQNPDDYVTELLIDVDGIEARVLVDAYNMEVRACAEAFNSRIDMLLDESGTLYLNVGDARLAMRLSQIDQLMGVIGKFVNVDASFTQADVNVKEIINSIGFTSDKNSGSNLNLAIGSVKVIVALTENASLKYATVNAAGLDVTVSLASGGQYPTFDTTADYVNVVDVLETYADNVAELINANGFAFDVNGEFAFGSNNYNVTAHVVYNENIFVDATLALSDVNAIRARIWLVDGILYADVNGLTIKLAISTDGNKKSSESKSLTQTLAELTGYNDDLDIVLNLVSDVIAKADTLNFSALLGNVTFDNGALTLNINGAQLELSDLAVTIEKSANGVSATMANLKHRHISANFTATVAATEEQVVAPAGDFTTNLVVALDQQNNLYANLDLIAHEYRFALENVQSGGCLYVLYKDGSFKIAKPETTVGAGDAASVSGNIAAIKSIVTKIDYMVKQLSNGLPIEFNEDGSVPAYKGASDILTGNLFGGSLDLKELVKSIEIAVNQSANTVTAKLSVMGLNAEITLLGGDYPTIENIYLPIDLLDMELNARPDALHGYVDFDNISEYVEIDKVLEDYFPTITELVLTNCWKFEFTMDSQIDVYDAVNNTTDSYRIAQGSYVEFFYNQKLPDELTVRALIKVQTPTSDGSSFQDLVTLDVLFGKDGSGQKRLWITYNNDLKLTVAMDSIFSCVGLFDELKTAIPQIATLIDGVKETMSTINGNLENIDYSTLIRAIGYDSEMSTFDLTLNAGVLLSNLGDLTLQVSRDDNSLTLNKLTLCYNEFDDKGAVTKTISVLLQGLKVSAAERLTEGDASSINTPSDYEIAALADNFFASYGLYNADTDTYVTDNFLSFDSLPELLKAVIDTANKTTFAIDGLITAKLDISSYVGNVLSGAVKLTLPLMVSARIDRVQHGNGNEDVYIAVMLKRFDTKANILGGKHDFYNDKGGQSYLYYDSTVEYTDENGKTQHGWIWVSRYPNTNETSTEAWTETNVHDHCVDCNAEASDNCYLTWCNICGKEADDNCKTVGWCAQCKAVTDHCNIDYCSQCGKPADENCYIDYCNDCNAAATDECKTQWCFKCNKEPDWKCLLHNKGTKHNITTAHSNKIVAAHNDKVHTAESVRAPHTVNTIVDEIHHDSGKPVLGSAAHEWNGSATEFMNGTVENNGYTITNMENELYEMMNLGTIKLMFGAVKLDLQQIIVKSIHDNNNQTEVTIESLLSNLQNILKNYEYVVPQGTGEDDIPFFRLTADLSSINSSFGVLDLTIGHTVSYTEKEIKDVFGEVASQKVIDQLNLSYLRGTFRLANVMDLNFKLNLAQNWEDYIGDAQYYVQYQPLWDAADHAGNFQ